jgi:CheY-like chemotaxis protein
MYQIDIVFIDNQMPNLNGTTVTKLLRGIKFNKIIIGITDCPKDELLEFNNSGIDYVFKKPFDKYNKEILFNFLNKNDLNRYPDKKLTLVDTNLEWI